ncbi:hypothetical protein M3J09_000978 [Ascochyta lentis]
MAKHRARYNENPSFNSPIMHVFKLYCVRDSLPSTRSYCRLLPGHSMAIPITSLHLPQTIPEQMKLLLNYRAICHHVLSENTRSPTFLVRHMQCLTFLHVDEELGWFQEGDWAVGTML